MVKLNLGSEVGSHINTKKEESENERKNKDNIIYRMFSSDTILYSDSCIGEYSCSMWL
jgi:hypothetical protein